MRLHSKRVQHQFGCITVLFATFSTTMRHLLAGIVGGHCAHDLLEQSREMLVCMQFFGPKDALKAHGPRTQNRTGEFSFGPA